MQFLLSNFLACHKGSITYVNCKIALKPVYDGIKRKKEMLVLPKNKKGKVLGTCKNQIQTFRPLIELPRDVLKAISSPPTGLKNGSL